MTPKQAIMLAKAWVQDIFAEEGVEQVDLEEVRFDDEKRQWLITVGFYRLLPNRSPSGLGGLLLGHARKSFKTVRIDDRAESVLSMEHRAVESTDG